MVMPHLPSHGFCPSLDEAKAKFAETWRAWLVLNCQILGCGGAGLVSQIIRREVERLPGKMAGAWPLKEQPEPSQRTNSPICLTSRDLLRLVDRIFRSRFLRSGLLPWHYSRIRNHFRDVDRL